MYVAICMCMCTYLSLYTYIYIYIERYMYTYHMRNLLGWLETRLAQNTLNYLNGY